LKADLYEVWGDTVNSRHLIYSIGIGAVVSLSAFFLAQQIFLSLVASAQMARAYAMLVGILGCLGGGAISAMLFKPKRHVVEHQADPAWRAEVLLELEKEFGDLGKIADLPPAVVAELREMDLLELFVEHEKAQTAAPAQPSRSADPELGLAGKGGAQ